MGCMEVGKIAHSHIEGAGQNTLSSTQSPGDAPHSPSPKATSEEASFFVGTDFSFGTRASDSSFVSVYLRTAQR